MINNASDDDWIQFWVCTDPALVRPPRRASGPSSDLLLSLARSLVLCSPLQARVSASYLPQLIRTQIEYPFALPPFEAYTNRMNHDWNDWMNVLLSSVPFNRLVRERPDEAIALERAIVNKISHFSVPDIAVSPHSRAVSTSTFQVKL